MTPEQIAAVAGKLTKAQREGLNRLARRMVYVDGRSLRALVRKGLAKIHGYGTDALIGDFTISTITPLGIAVRAHLEKEARL